jgi:hypothetical protein
MSPGAAAAAGVTPSQPFPDAFYVPWPIKLGGDTIPTITVTALYRPPAAVSAVITNSSPTPKDGAPTTTVSTSTTVTPSPDQAITLLSMPLPQVHPLYYYNVAMGVVASTVHNPSFYRLQQTAQSPGIAASYATVRDNGDPSIAPVVLFTAYFCPLDAERRWNPKDLIPGLSFGFSLTSPSTSFYVGASVEIRRNVQFVAGLNVAKVTALAPVGFVDPASSAAPVTKQSFRKGGFAGLTLNIDFIKGLFGGGGGGGSKGS